MTIDVSNVFKHKTTGQFIYYPTYVPESKEHRSLRILRRSMKTYKNRWNIFITLTYSPEYVDDARSDHIRKFLNRFKQKTRNKINKYKKDKKYDISILNSELEKLKETRFVWKVEFDSTGKREVNPHFHLLLDVKYWLKLKYLHDWWGFYTKVEGKPRVYHSYGNIDFEVIKTSKKAKIYITKYFKKETKNVDWAYRKWGKSRNLKTKIKSDWKFYSVMYTEYALQLSLLTQDDNGSLVGYQIIIILKKNRAKFVRARKLQLLYFQWFKSKWKNM